MLTEFRKADVGKEIRSLMAFDRKIFPAADTFPSVMWRECTAYWLLVQGKKAGCCAFQESVDFTGHAMPGSLYIATTGIVREYQGKGLGNLMKSWQIAYARYHGFQRLVTNMRESNAAMVKLNEKHGFRPVRSIAEYYEDPDEDSIVMELRL